MRNVPLPQPYKEMRWVLGLALAIRKTTPAVLKTKAANLFKIISSTLSIETFQTEFQG